MTSEFQFLLDTATKELTAYDGNKRITLTCKDLKTALQLRELINKKVLFLSIETLGEK
jgi:hypothetical protein